MGQRSGVQQEGSYLVHGKEGAPCCWLLRMRMPFADYFHGALSSAVHSVQTCSVTIPPTWLWVGSPATESGRQNSRASAYSLWGPMPDPLSCLIYYCTSFFAAASHFLKFKLEPRVCPPAPPAALSSLENDPFGSPSRGLKCRDKHFFHVAQFLLEKPSPRISSPSPPPPQPPEIYKTHF